MIGSRGRMEESIQVAVGCTVNFIVVRYSLPRNADQSPSDGIKLSELSVMMATCCLEKDSSVQAGVQEGSPPRQYALGGGPHFWFTKADINQV